VHVARFSPDRKHILTCGDDATVSLCQISTHRYVSLIAAKAYVAHAASALGPAAKPWSKLAIVKLAFSVYGSTPSGTGRPESET